MRRAVTGWGIMWLQAKMMVITLRKQVINMAKVMENILLPQGIYRNQPADSDLQVEELGLELMNRMGIGHLADALAKELSGGITDPDQREEKHDE